MTSPAIPTGAVTAADLFAQVSAARQDLTLILTKVEVMSDRHDRMNRDLADVQSRMRALELSTPAKLAERVIALERWQWRAGGIVAAFAVLGGVVAGLLEAVIGRLH